MLQAGLIEKFLQFSEVNFLRWYKAKKINREKCAQATLNALCVIGGLIIIVLSVTRHCGYGL